MQTLRVVRANPAGNITLLVLDDVAPAARPSLARRLMAMPRFGAEQVGFAAPAAGAADGRLDMMGGEFCGNAARAYGLYLARERGMHPQTLSVQVGGQPVTVRADPAAKTAAADMPLPRSMRECRLKGLCCDWVEFEGIVHLVVPSPPDERLWEQAQALFWPRQEILAWGVLFWEAAGGRLTPVVTVRATELPVWESSCGSGSVAVAAAQTRHLFDGTSRLALSQPGGVIEATAVRKNGALCSVCIGSAVEIEPPVCVAIESGLTSV